MHKKLLKNAEAVSNYPQFMPIFYLITTFKAQTFLSPSSGILQLREIIRTLPCARSVLIMNAASVTPECHAWHAKLRMPTILKSLFKN